MTMVGFDVAKNTLVAAVLDQTGELLENVLLANTDEILRTWLADRQRYYPNVQVSCESTGYYHYALLRVAADLSVPCRLLNPILTKQAIKNTIRGKKTDRTDAILIARLGLRGEGHLATPEPTAAKTLLRSSVQLKLIEVQLRLLQKSLSERQVILPTKANRALTTVQSSLTKVVDEVEQLPPLSSTNHILERLCRIPGVGRSQQAVVVSELAK